MNSRRISVLMVALSSFLFGSSMSVVLRGVHAESGSPGAPTAGRVATGYEYDKQVAAAFRATLSSADTLTQAGILATTELLVSGKQNITIGGWFSATGNTCQVQVVYIYKAPTAPSSTDTATNIIKGFSPIYTLSGGSVVKNSVYPAPDITVDGEGANAARVILITGPGGGTVDLRAGTS